MKTLVFVPTYNERENVRLTYDLIKALGMDLDLLFLDDNSPDGTGLILDDIAASDQRVRVIHRSGKQGIGSAHLEGIRFAYQNRYPILVTMDCDLTHPAEHIPDLLALAEHADLVLGSRFMRNESLADWNLFRKSLTHIGHFLTRRLLKVPYDATGGFRLYRLDKLNPRVFDLVNSTGYSFFFESLYILCLNRARVKEVPINLPKRTYGHSKMSIRDILGSLQKLFSLYCQSFRLKSELRKLAQPETADAS